MHIRLKKAIIKPPPWIKAAAKKPKRLFAALKLCLTPAPSQKLTTPTNLLSYSSNTSIPEATCSSEPVPLAVYQETASSIGETVSSVHSVTLDLLDPVPITSTSSSRTSLEVTKASATCIALPPPPSLSEEPTMASTESRLEKILKGFSTNSFSPTEAAERLKWAKSALLSMDALLPTPETRPIHLFLARGTLEAGALHSISAQDADGFTRYWQQLQSFYELPSSRYPKDAATSQKNKITGLYLMLLLTQKDYAGFHTVLEGLEMENALKEAPSHTSMPTGRNDNAHRRDSLGRAVLEGDVFLKYPVMLEQWLMEGAYDRVWVAVKKDGVPSEEFAVFSEVLEHTIRSEIASCSEKSYPFVPISSAKTLFFLDSEGAVLQFAKDRGWVARDGRIYFPNQQDGNERSEREILKASGQVIENTIGYARELETIV